MSRNLSNPLVGHPTRGAGRGKARRGRAGRGGARRVGAGQGEARRGRAGRARGERGMVARSVSARGQPFISTFKATKTTVLVASSEAQAKEILCKPNRRTRRAVDERFISGTTAALRSWLLTDGPTRFVSVNPFQARHVRESKGCPGTNRIQNPDIPRARPRFARRLHDPSFLIPNCKNNKTKLGVSADGYQWATFPFGRRPHDVAVQPPNCRRQPFWTSLWRHKGIIPVGSRTEYHSHRFVSGDLGTLLLPWLD